MKKATVCLLAGAALALFLSGCEIPLSQGGRKEAGEDVSQTQVVEKGNRLVTVPDPGSYILLGQYQDRTWEIPPATKEQVEEEIERRLQADSSSMKGNQTVQEGDTVVINYVGSLGYKTFEGSIANNYQFTVGDGELLPDLEEALIGMKAGESASITHGDALYWFTLQSFTRPATLTEEWAKEDGYEGVENMRESVKAELEKAILLDPARQKEEIFKILLSEAQVLDYPKADLADAAASYQKLLARYARESSMDYDSFLSSQGLTEESLQEAMRSFAEKKVLQDLALQTIIDEQDISLEDEVAQRLTKELADTYAGGDINALNQTFDKDELLEALAYERVTLFLMEGR